jgi:hypothetical protein
VKRLTLVCFLLCCVLCWSVPADSDHGINIHVSGTRMMRDTRSSSYYESLIVTIDGKKCELESLHSPNALLQLGDYKARLVMDKHWSGPYESYRVYELLLPDNKKRQFLLVAQGE